MRKWWIHYGPMVIFICLHFTVHHYHHFADVIEGIELEIFVRYILLRVCPAKIKSFLSIIFHEMYGTVFIHLTPVSYDDCENMCVPYFITIIKSEVWPICHFCGLGYETILVCAVCLSILHIMRRNRITGIGTNLQYAPSGNSRGYNSKFRSGADMSAGDTSQAPYSQ